MDVIKSYSRIAQWYNTHRNRDLYEKYWLDKAIFLLKPKSSILDLGCGMGEPIANYFIDNGFDVTGVDGCKELIHMAKNNVPKANFIVQGMRKLNLKRKFDLIIAWNSFFHLSPQDQRNMFKTFTIHLNIEGLLMFTTGPEAGEVISDNGGEELYHASLEPEEYKKLLTKFRFNLIDFKIKDFACNDHTVWIAKFIGM